MYTLHGNKLAVKLIFHYQYFLCRSSISKLVTRYISNCFRGFETILLIGYNTLYVFLSILQQFFSLWVAYRKLVGNLSADSLSTVCFGTSSSQLPIEGDIPTSFIHRLMCTVSTPFLLSEDIKSIFHSGASFFIRSHFSLGGRVAEWFGDQT